MNIIKIIDAGNSGTIFPPYSMTLRSKRNLQTTARATFPYLQCPANRCEKNQVDFELKRDRKHPWYTDKDKLSACMHAVNYDSDLPEARALPANVKEKLQGFETADAIITRVKALVDQLKLRLFVA